MGPIRVQGGAMLALEPQGDGDVSRDFEYVMVFKLKSPEGAVEGADSLVGGNQLPERVWMVLKALLDAGMDILPFFASKTSNPPSCLARCWTACKGLCLKQAKQEDAQERLLFVLITASHLVLNEFADDKEYQVALDAVEVQRALRRGNVSRKWRSRVIAESDGLSEWGPYDYMYGKWESELGLELGLSLASSPSQNPNSAMDIYRGLQWDPAPADGSDRSNMVMFQKYSLHRLVLVNMMIRTERMNKGAGLQIETLRHHNHIDAFFPLHNEPFVKVLLEACGSWTLLPWRYPIERLKDYFGYQIGIWFLFMGHYSFFLLGPGLVGLVFQIAVWASGPNYSSPVLPPFGAFICIWSIYMLAYWRRLEKKRAFMWGQSEFETTEQFRPEFEGYVVRSFVDGKLTMHFPDDSFDRRARFSTVVIVSLVIMVVGAVAGIYVMKFVLTKPLGSTASTIASIVNTIQIHVFNYIYSKVARLLVENENCRTETEFNDSLISKMFMFTFVNSYASFFYIAFVAAYLEPVAGADPEFRGQCGYYNCMQPLAVNLGIIFGSSIIINNLVTLALSWYTHRGRFSADFAGLDESKLSSPEREYALQKFDSSAEMMKVYSNLTIQYGFSILFVCALPMSCACSLVSNHFGIKMQLWKMLKMSQRPLPLGAQDIGPWYGILSIISMLAVLTNAGLICFTMDVLGTDAQVLRNGSVIPVASAAQVSFSPVGRLWVFVCFVVSLLLLQVFIHVVVPPESDDVTLQKKRQDFVREKLIEGVPDDDWFDAIEEVPDMVNVEPEPGFFKTWDLSSCFKTPNPRGDYVTLGAKLSGNEDLVDGLSHAIPIHSEFNKGVVVTRNSLTEDEEKSLLKPRLVRKKYLQQQQQQQQQQTTDTNTALSVTATDVDFLSQRVVDAGSGFVAGARVEGKLHGELTELYYPGTITRVNRTYDVKFDDESRGSRKDVAPSQLQLVSQEAKSVEAGGGLGLGPGLGPGLAGGLVEGDKVIVKVITLVKAKDRIEGTIINVSRTYDIDFDDKGIRKEIKEKDLRNIDEKTFSDVTFRLSHATVDEFDQQVFYRAVRRGRPGLDFIAFNKAFGFEIKKLSDEARIIATIDECLATLAATVENGAVVLRSSSSNNGGGVNSDCYRLQAQQLYADIFQMCAFTDAFRFGPQGGYDQLSSCLQLFYCARNLAIERRMLRELSRKELFKTRGCFSEGGFNLLDGLREMQSNQYIREAWRMREDPNDCYTSVVELNKTLGVVCAFVLIISIPQGLAVNNITEKSSGAYIAYLFCISVTSLTEGLAVLISARNLIALNTLKPENIKPYLDIAQDVIMAPVRLNFFAILSMICALNLWAYAHNGPWMWLGFFVLICVPTVYAFVIATGSGIKHLFEVQPWRTRKFGAHDLDVLLQGEI